MFHAHKDNVRGIQHDLIAPRKLSCADHAFCHCLPQRDNVTLKSALIICLLLCGRVISVEDRNACAIGAGNRLIEKLERFSVNKFHISRHCRVFRFQISEQNAALIILELVNKFLPLLLSAVIIQICIDPHHAVDLTGALHCFCDALTQLVICVKHIKQPSAVIAAAQRSSKVIIYAVILAPVDHIGCGQRDLVAIGKQHFKIHHIALVDLVCHAARLEGIQCSEILCAALCPVILRIDVAIFIQLKQDRDFLKEISRCHKLIWTLEHMADAAVSHKSLLAILCADVARIKFFHLICLASDTFNNNVRCINVVAEIREHRRVSCHCRRDRKPAFVFWLENIKQPQCCSPLSEYIFDTPIYNAVKPHTKYCM